MANSTQPWVFSHIDISSTKHFLALPANSHTYRGMPVDVYIWADKRQEVGAPQPQGKAIGDSLPMDFRRVRLFVTPWTVARQAPLSMGFSRQEYWNGLLFPPLAVLPKAGIEPKSHALQVDSLQSEPPGNQEEISRTIKGRGEKHNN